MIELPLPISWAAMEAAHGDLEIREFYIKNSSGSKEAVNELLDFSVMKVTDNGFWLVEFDGIAKSVRVIETEILTLVAQKVSQIINLSILRIERAT